MSNKDLKPKIPVITEPIVKKVSSFVGGNSIKSKKKVIPNKDAYKRM